MTLQPTQKEIKYCKASHYKYFVFCLHINSLRLDENSEIILMVLNIVITDISSFDLHNFQFT